MLKYAKWSWRAFGLFVALMLAAFIAAMVLISGAKREAEQEQAALQEELVSVTEERSLLLRQLDSVGTDSYIEDAARNEYGYVKPGEISFEIQNADLLDNYTAEEWQIILDEMAWDGR